MKREDLSAGWLTGHKFSINCASSRYNSTSHSYKWSCIVSKDRGSEKKSKKIVDPGAFESQEAQAIWTLRTAHGGRRREDEALFVNFMQMLPEIFDELLLKVSPRITKQTTTFPEPGLILALTLRHLVSGAKYKIM